VTRCLVLTAATAAAIATASTTAAQPRRAPADIRAVIPAASLEASTLIGRSGQLYVPRAEGGWKREGRGGVACDILDAFRLSGTLWAACRWAPLFSRDGGVWSARPLANRGPSRVARAGNRVIVSVGRHIYTWRGDWKRVSSAPGRITSLHAESASRLVAVTSRRQVIRGSGNNWSVVVDAPRRRDKNADPAERVFGSSRFSYAITEGGALAEIGRSSLSPVKLPAGVTRLDIDAAVELPGGDVLAGAVIRRGERQASGLVRLRGGTATIEPAPELLAGERVSLLYLQGSDLLLTTRRGRAFVRGEAGTWSTRPLINDPPGSDRSAANGGPAPTR
jgi:hypothetical protein